MRLAHLAQLHRSLDEVFLEPAIGDLPLSLVPYGLGLAVHELGHILLIKIIIINLIATFHYINIERVDASK